MKKQINASNEQSLAQKNQADTRVRQVNRQVDGTANRPTAAKTPVVKATANRQVNAQPTAQPAVNVNRAVNTTAQNSAAQRSVPQQRSAQTAARPTQSAQSSTAQVRPAQVQPAQQRPQAQPAQRQTSQNRVNPVSNTAASTAKPVSSAQRAVVSQSQQKPVQQRSVVQNQEKPVRTSAEKETRIQMMKTRTTDITPMSTDSLKYSGKSAVKPAEKKEKPSQYSDEGGNTVVSVVKAVVYIIFVIVIAVFLALVIINVGNDVFSFVKSDEMVEVTIPEYATLDEVADILYKNDIIKYPTIFKLYAVAKKADTDFLAGTYPVNGMMNYSTLLGEFKEKPESGTVDITIPEGYTIDEMIDLFVEGYGIGTREGFVDVIQNGEFDYWFIDELEQNGIKDGRVYRLEGYLFPDTYQFYKASSEYTVVDKMLKRFSQIFKKDYREQCAVLGYTVDEMITLASIIEKEAGSPSDFFVVSSVFHNRLKTPWQFPKLESDATVVYVLSHEKGERTTVTAEDLKLDTPYNTYLYDGFPPGPIANPSASAMLAALLPQDTNYFYFVTNKGVLYPSATKEQHDAYVAQFREEAAQAAAQ